MEREYYLAELQGLIPEINDLFKRREHYPLKAADVAQANPWLSKLVEVLTPQSGWNAVHQYGEPPTSKLVTAEKSATIIAKYPERASFKELHRAGLPHSFHFEWRESGFVWVKTTPILPPEIEMLLH